jgi:glycosyltransferase involved in cell wall biosynthesis
MSTGINPFISLVVCTYNRCDLLAFCLQALSNQSVANEVFEVLVVDNNSSDRTQELVRTFMPRMSNLLLVAEDRQGLSHARNRGVVEANSEWVYFVDDDAKVTEDFVERAIALIHEVRPRVFGGSFSPWFHYGRPPWFDDSYASSDLQFSCRSVLPRGKFLTGCNFAVHKSIFSEFGMFDPELGMRGNLVGYGEETELQRSIQQAGVPIWFDPGLRVEHVVNPERLTPDWYLVSGWALGRDKVKSGALPQTKAYYIGVFVTMVALTAFDAIRNGVRLGLSQRYRKENWWIDTFRKAAKRAAILYTASLHAPGVKRS